MDNNTLVIVLSRNYSTGLGVIRSLGEAGYEVCLLASARRRGSSYIASSSKYVSRAAEVLTPDIYGDDGEEFIRALYDLTAGDERTKVLFPCDDYTTSVVDLHRRKLSEDFLMPGLSEGNDGSLVSLMDKEAQAKLAEDAGLVTARAHTIDLEDDLRLPEDMVYPCFIKPLKSISGEKTEMAVCSDAEALMKKLGELKAGYAKRSVLIQEYLRIDKEYDMGGVALKEEVIIPSVIEKIRVAGHERGVTMMGKMVPCRVIGEEVEKIRRLLRDTGYRGMFDIEFLEAGGKIYFNEINFRSGGPHFSYYLNGVDLPALFVKDITGLSTEEDKKELREMGKTFIYEKVAWEDYIYGYMNRKELKAALKSTDYTLLGNSGDPAPGKIFNRRIRLSAIKQKTLRLLKGK